jgi:hypothetical protein
VPRIPLAVAALAVALTLAVPAQGAPATLPPLQAPQQLRTLSYYPSDGGWTLMWDDWRPDELRSDFARIAGLHANTVRLIVQAGTFGYPQPTLDYEARLAQAIDLAAQAGLHVQLTLFDWLGQHGLGGSYADIAGSEQWASALLAPYVRDPRIACVELQNELNPQDPAAVAWARALLPYVQGLLQHATPTTVSPWGPQPVEALRELAGALAPAAPDFWSIHLFTGGGERAYWQLRDAMRAVAPRRLWVGETGYPTLATVSGYSDLPQTAGAQEAAQAHFLKTTAQAAWRLGLPAPGVWVLDDFTTSAIPVPPADQQPPEYHFGLFRLNGAAKPAAAVVRDLFARGRPSLAFDEGFETGADNGYGALVPAEWSAHGDTNMQLVQDVTVAHSGLASARVRSEDGVSGHAYFDVAPIDAAALPRATAVVSAWTRVASPGADVRLEVDWLDGSSRYVARRSSSRAAATGGWVRLAVRATRPARGRSVRIYLVGARVTGSVWFDDVRFAWR